MADARAKTRKSHFGKVANHAYFQARILVNISLLSGRANSRKTKFETRNSKFGRTKELRKSKFGGTKKDEIRKPKNENRGQGTAKRRNSILEIRWDKEGRNSKTEKRKSGGRKQRKTISRTRGENRNSVGQRRAKIDSACGGTKNENRGGRKQRARTVRMPDRSDRAERTEKASRRDCHREVADPPAPIIQRSIRGTCSDRCCHRSPRPPPCRCRTCRSAPRPRRRPPRLPRSRDCAPPRSSSPRGFRPAW